MISSTTYDVVVLVEQALSELDSREVRGVHEEIEDTVRYHVLQLVDDAAERIESAMGALATGDAVGGATLAMAPDDVQELQHELLPWAREALDQSLAVLHAAGADAVGDVVTDEP